jgi:hypothetical protein
VFFSAVNAVFCQDVFLYKDVTPVNITSPRDNALGGTHRANSGGFDSIWTNPAAFFSFEEKVVFNLSASVNGELGNVQSSVPDILSGNDIDEQRIKKYADANMQKAPPSFYIRGPIFFGYSGKGFGIGVFNKMFIESLINYDTDNATYRANLNNDFVVNSAFSFSLIDDYKNKFYLGMGAKLFLRNVHNLVNQTAFVGLNSERDKFTKVDSSEKNIIGAGFSLGLLYTAGNIFSLGFTIDDAASVGYMFRSKDEPGAAGDPLFLFLPRINGGISFKIVDNTSLQWSIMADYNDLLSIFPIFLDRTLYPMVNISAGTEAIFFKSFSVRLGFTQLLPSAGISYKFSRIIIDASVYGKEYDLVRSEYPTYGVDIGIKVSF